jgi:hypothetical protein
VERGGGEGVLAGGGGRGEDNFESVRDGLVMNESE